MVCGLKHFFSLAIRISFTMIPFTIVFIVKAVRGLIRGREGARIFKLQCHALVPAVR